MRTLCGHRADIVWTLCRHCADIVPTYILREMLCGQSADIVPTLCGHCADIYLQGYMSAQCPHNLEYRLTDRFENPVIADTLVTCDDVSVVELRDGGHVPDGGQDVEQGLLHSTS